MKIEQIDANKIRVTVDPAEQEAFGVRYETMDYGDEATRRLCDHILCRAKRQVGFCTDNARLLVEARRACNGAVTLYLSRIPLGQATTCRRTFCFEPDGFLDAKSAFEVLSPPPQRAEVYIFEGRVYLVVEAVCDPAEGGLFRALGEFGERSSLTADFLREHGQFSPAGTAFFLEKKI